MNHPIFIAALVEERRRRCPCGTVAPQLYGLCRECQAVAVSHRGTERTRQCDALSWIPVRTLKARLLAQVASLLQIIGKGAES